MSLSLSVGYTDTALDPDPGTLNFVRAELNFTEDFRVKSQGADETLIINTTSPADRPEKGRIAISEVADVYKGTGIDSGYYGPSRKGVSFVAQLTNVLSVSDSSDSTYRVDLPISAHLVVKVPYNNLLTASVVQTHLSRLLSLLFDEGVTDTARIDAMLRGVSKPTEL